MRLTPVCPLPLLLSFAMLVSAVGCSVTPRHERRHDIPTRLLDGYDALVILPPQASEGLRVSVPEGSLAMLETEIRREISGFALNRLAPPPLQSNASFRGRSAELHVNVVRCDEVSVESRFSRTATRIEIDVAVQFVDSETYEPLADWVNLGEAAGPATGRSVADALRAAAHQVALHIVRDRRG
ncbi:MAG: hypothetical protein HUU25_00305 [Candidatus Sumerlaeia bacterium]|nr:hypothetical protein [Candidatus Sumerlaeia bacterium]